MHPPFVCFYKKKELCVIFFSYLPRLFFLFVLFCCIGNSLVRRSRIFLRPVCRSDMTSLKISPDFLLREYSERAGLCSRCIYGPLLQTRKTTASHFYAILSSHVYTDIRIAAMLLTRCRTIRSVARDSFQSLNFTVSNQIGYRTLNRWIRYDTNQVFLSFYALNFLIRNRKTRIDEIGNFLFTSSELKKEKKY